MGKVEMNKSIATGAIAAMLSLLVLFIGATVVHAAAKSAFSPDMGATDTIDNDRMQQNLSGLAFGNISTQLDTKAAELDSLAAGQVLARIEFRGVLNLWQA